MNSMTTNAAKGFFSSIRTKMLISFVLLFIFALVSIELVRIYGVPFTDFSGEYEMEQARVFKNLDLVADLKKERLSRWLKERKDDANVIAESGLIKTHLTELKTVIRENMGNRSDNAEIWAGVKKSKVFQILYNHLTIVMNTYGVYSEIEIIDPQSEIVIVSSRKKAVGLISRDGRYPMSILRDYDVHAHLDDKHMNVSIHRHIKIKSMVIAVLVVHVNTNDFIQPLLHTGEGLGRSGEALLVDQDIRILTSLKHILPDGTVPEPLKFRIDSKPATFAARGEEGIISAVDYRGVPVLAAYRHVRITPEIGWGLVVKRDLEEVFAPFKSKLFNSMLISVFVSIFVVLIIVVIVRSISGPLLALSDTAQKIEKGDFGARAPVSSSDEVGSLSKTFNSMVQRIQEWHTKLEEQVKDRTSELNSTNQELNLEINERRKAEKEAEDIFNLSPDMMCVSTFEGKIVKVNPAWEKVLGYTADEILELGWEKLIHPDDIALVNKEIEKQLDGNSIVDFTNRYRCKNGTYKTFEWNALPSENNMVYAIARDITERKKADEVLKNYGILFSQINDLAYICDAKGNVLFLNNAFEILTGRKSKEFIGKSFASLFDEESLKIAMDNYTMTLNGEKPWYELRFKDTGILCEYKNMPLLDEKGKIIGVLGIDRDITERNKLEEERQKIHKLEAIGILAGGIAHDFNNLLASIRNNIYLAMMHVDRKNIAYENLESTENIIHRATNLTQQLLTFSRGGAPVKKTASIAELINESAEFVLKGSNITCECSVADNLWPVDVDKGQMNQVIHNLILNAAQSMPEGGMIRINIENSNLDAGTGLLLPKGKYVKVVIQDEGAGIAKKHLQNIFDPYFTTKQMGHGLGLSITYSIIKKHYGHISVESETGVGTTFTIYLPASEKQIKDKESVDDTFASGDGKVLIMDDEEIIRESVEQLLTYKGYEIECAKDGDEAIALYKKAMEKSKPFDAVILDLTIRGGMGGKETVKKLLEIDPDVKAIVASGYSNDPVLSNFREYGFCGVFAKHDKVEELGKTLHDVIRGQQ